MLLLFKEKKVLKTQEVQTESEHNWIIQVKWYPRILQKLIAVKRF